MINKIEFIGFGENTSKVEEMVRECLTQLAELNIEVGNITTIKLNKRYRAKWGTCGKTDKENFKIELAQMLFEAKDKHIQETIMHEILHACKDSKGHGKVWKEYARRVNEAYGYNVKTCTSSEEKELVEEPVEYKYILKCTKCGEEFGRNRFVNAVRKPQDYRCAECDGKIIRIK